MLFPINHDIGFFVNKNSLRLKLKTSNITINTYGEAMQKAIKVPKTPKTV
jgi:hypothetical protein